MLIHASIPHTIILLIGQHNSVKVLFHFRCMFANFSLLVWLAVIFLLDTKIKVTGESQWFVIPFHRPLPRLGHIVSAQKDVYVCFNTNF